MNKHNTMTIENEKTSGRRFMTYVVAFHFGPDLEEETLELQLAQQTVVLGLVRNRQVAQLLRTFVQQSLRHVPEDTDKSQLTPKVRKLQLTKNKQQSEYNTRTKNTSITKKISQKKIIKKNFSKKIYQKIFSKKTHRKKFIKNFYRKKIKIEMNPVKKLFNIVRKKWRSEIDIK